MSITRATTEGAGPIAPELVAELPAPPLVTLPGWAQTLRFEQRQIEFVFRVKRELGEVFAMRPGRADGRVVTGLPDDVRSLLMATPPRAAAVAPRLLCGPGRHAGVHQHPPPPPS